MLGKSLLSRWINPEPNGKVPRRKGKEEFKTFSLWYKKDVSIDFQRWKVTMRNLAALQGKGLKRKKKRTSTLYSLLELFLRQMLDFCTVRHTPQCAVVLFFVFVFLSLP